MREGRLGYNSSNDRYGLLSSDLWIDTGFHCGECLEVLIDDQWVQTRMEMNPAREWYLVYPAKISYNRHSWRKYKLCAISGTLFRRRGEEHNDEKNDQRHDWSWIAGS